MFNSGNPIIMFLGAIIALVFIVGSVWWVNKLFTTNTKAHLVKFVIVIFTSLVSIFIIDKTIAHGANILTNDESENLFNLIENLTIMIFSYYFGTKNSKSDDEQS
jgi:hypothetical protein